MDRVVPRTRFALRLSRDRLLVLSFQPVVRVEAPLSGRVAAGLVASLVCARAAARRHGRAVACLVLIFGAAASTARASGLDLQYRVWTTEEGLPQGSVYSIAQTPDGYLWIATLDGLVRFDGIRMVVFSNAEFPTMTSNRLLALLVDRRGTLWMGTEDGGILRKDGTTFHAYRRSSGLESDTILSLAEDRNGSLWAWTTAGRMVLQGDRWTPPEETAERPASWTASLRGQRPDVPAGRRTPDPMLWTTGGEGRTWALDGGHLHSRENGSWRTFSNPVPAVALQAPRTLFEDAEGTLWIGSDRGLVQAIQTPVRAVVPGGVTSNVYTLAEDHTGRVWVGTEGDPLVLERGVSAPLVGRSWWPRAWITAIEPDTDGSILAGGSSGLFRIWPGRRYEQLREGPAVVDVHRDRRGAVWVATGAGLLRSSAEGWDRVDGLPSVDIKVLLEGRDGALWVGTYGGLGRVHGEDVQAWTTADGLSSDRIRALHEDEAGALWIGTYDGGLNRFAGGRFDTIRKRDGLYDDGVFVILDDGAGRYYMCSNRGIHSVPKRELEAFASGTSRDLTYRAWRKVDGMPSSECNGGRQPSGFRAADGTLWFPTQGGIAVLDPRAVPQNPVPPPIAIEDVRIDRRPIAPGQPVALAPGERRLEVRYTANTFVRPEGARFRHRLAGYDDDWIDAGSARVLQYAQLPPGRYVLTIAAANSDGVWNMEGSSLEVVVLPAFYQTWWFRAFVVIGVSGLAAVLLRRREAVLKRAHAAQQAFSRQLIATQEAERKRFAAELHDSLGQRLVIIKNLATLAARADPGGARARVDEIAGEASHAIAEVREIARDLRPHHLDRLGLTKALAALVRGAGDASSTVFTADLDRMDGVFPKSAEIHVYRVVQESLSNILKHAQATEARVTIRRAPDRIVLTVQDNGVGMAAQASADSRAAGGGFGLAGIMERVTLLGGRAELRSAPGGGTIVSVTFNPAKLPSSPDRDAGLEAGGA